MERRKFDKEFRRNAVNLLLTSGKTQKQLCADLGVPYGLIGKWRRVTVSARSVLPDTVWVSDITYVPSAEGWLYLCIVKDLCTREIVGYSLARHMRAEMVCAALDRAVKRRRPGEGLIFHSDRGSQYASREFRATLKRYGMQQSMSGKGNCCDNACAESFFASFKCELVHDMQFSNFEEAEKMIFTYIEIFYNRQRRMECLGNLSPANYAATLAA